MFKTYGGKMSKYTGKHDLYDHFSSSDISIEKLLDNTNIYFFDYPYTKLDIKTEKDLAPFFCHVPSMITGNNIYLRQRNYLDTREEEQLEYTYKELIKLFNKCKRNHLDFEEEYNKIKQDKWIVFSSGMTDEEKYKIFNLVRISKGKADIKLNNIPLSTMNNYRKVWYDDLLKLGWKESNAYLTAYGFDRWVQRVAKETKMDGD